MPQPGDSVVQLDPSKRVKGWIVMVIMCFINVLNYMDRFAISAVLIDIQKYYDIGDSLAGLLQTGFIMAHTISGPVFGYLGDRYSRKYLMAFGVILWGASNLLGTFMKNYWLFWFSRALVGIGQASFTVIAQTVIGDLFIENARTRMFTIFYFAIPIGWGMGCIVSSEVAKILGAWQWGIRITPAFCLVGALLMVFMLEVPKSHEREGAQHVKSNTLCDDLKMLSRNMSYVLCTVGFTCVCFIVGTLSWWGPKLAILGSKLRSNISQEESDRLSTLFGIATAISGTISLVLACLLSHFFKPKLESVDPIICGAGLIISCPLLCGFAFACRYSTVLWFSLLFFGQIGLLINMALESIIVLDVIVPARTSTAIGIHMFVYNTLGAAGSTYISGLISELCQSWLSTKLSGEKLQFQSLKYAFYVACNFELIGGVLFVANAFFLPKDKREMQRIINEEPS